MRASCGLACQCVEWAAAGECTRNEPFMNRSCTAACERAGRPAPPSAPPMEMRCIEWAHSGECVRNADFMSMQCAEACANVVRRSRCSARVCAGLPPALPCAGSSSSSGDGEPDDGEPHHNGTWPFAHSLFEVARNTSLALAFVNDRATPARLYWVDDSNVESGFGVLMPGARLVQQSYLGHHWRLRELSQAQGGEQGGGRAAESPLLLDVHAQVLVARPCICTPFLLRRSEHAASAASTVGFDDANATQLLVELRDSAECVVSKWRGAGAEEQLGVLNPRGAIAPNATHQLLVEDVRSGDVITVRRASSGETLMQHSAGDVRVEDRRCGTPHSRGGRAMASGGAARADEADLEANAEAAEEEEAEAAALALKLDALRRRRASAKAEAESMRAALEQLKQLDLKAVGEGSVDEELVGQYMANASEALLKKSRDAGERTTAPTVVRRQSAAPAGAAAGRGAGGRGRSRRRPAPREHDELRL